MAGLRQPRRANLATIVGSSLAVVAAGSLLAFSTLAEQAGLQGLATGRIEPAVPGRTGNGSHAITVPAPATAPPADPRDALAELVRESGRRAPEQAPPPAEALPPEEPPSPEDPERERPRRLGHGARVAVKDPVVEEEVECDGPPYGHAYGHACGDYKNKHKDPKRAKNREPKTRASERPVYARTTNDEASYKHSKPAKLEKVKKAKGPGNGNAKGHSKHAHKGKGDRSARRSAGKAKDHSKHGG